MVAVATPVVLNGNSFRDNPNLATPFRAVLQPVRPSCSDSPSVHRPSTVRPPAPLTLRRCTFERIQSDQREIKRINCVKIVVGVKKMSFRPRLSAAGAAGAVGAVDTGETRLEQVLRVGVAGVARRPIEQSVPTDAAKEIYEVVKYRLDEAVLSPPSIIIAIANVANGLHALLKNTGAMKLDSASNRYYATGEDIHKRIKKLDLNEEYGAIESVENYDGAWQFDERDHWMKATWNQWSRSADKPRYDKFVTIVLIARFFAETYIENSDKQRVYLLSEDIKYTNLSHEVKWIKSAQVPGKARFEMGSSGIKGVIDKKIKYDDLKEDRDKYIEELRSKSNGLPIEILITGNNEKWVVLNSDGTRTFSREGQAAMQAFVKNEQDIKFVPISQTTEGFYERSEALKMVGMPALGRNVTVIGYGGETGQVTTSDTECVLYGSLGEKADVAKLVKSAQDTYEAEFGAL